MGSRLVAGVLATGAAAGIVANMIITSRITASRGVPLPVTEWVFMVVALLMPALGWLLATRRPELRYGWLLLLCALFLGVGLTGSGLSITGAVPLWLSAPLSSVLALFYGLNWIFVPLLFPEGRLPSRRWRAFAWISGIAIALHAVGNTLSGGVAPQPTRVLESTLTLVGLLSSAAGQLITWIMAAIGFCGLVLRLRRSARVERRQYAWMVGGVAVSLLGGVAQMAFLTRVPMLALLGMVAMTGALPVAIGVTVVRHRLLDIGIGIRGSRLHLIFDVRPTVDEVLSDLGTALEGAPEPAEQLGRVAAAVRTALEATWAAVTLADGTRVVAGRQEGPATLMVPVHGGLGRIECGPRGVGGLTRVDRRLLEALAVPAGLAIQSAGLAARLVNAQEAERRRIERNIHDGVQQQLVALIAGLELARSTGASPDMLAHLREQARQTLADLRELAAGIHPSALGQGGLVEAVEERCSRLPVHTTVTSDPGLRTRRFADEVEGAMYFTVNEAVANALKHAGAATIEVGLSHAGGRLRATVADDGKGFDPGATARRGLATLSDRLDALGGGLDLDSSPGKGTLVKAWVPVDG
ncbi:sensor histidine kinase [Nonomuraea angiospora]|uniref:sensor histidine kinase n=1 Tax=Nonomuraea angiospora TaxID=46172 RepID=UPI0029BDE4CC|nr:histidine kinase [Nonomuraea angiospora]MDX3106034.1 histidine kinase [Nonomuraea angiospora]